FSILEESRNTIVLIANYRDSTRCAETLQSLFTNAARPDLVFLSFYDQIYHDEVTCMDAFCAKVGEANCRRNAVRRNDTLDAALATGPTKARYETEKGIDLTKDTFALAIDSHLVFVSHWDMQLKAEFDAVRNPKAILTAYPKSTTRTFDRWTTQWFGLNVVYHHYEARPVVWERDWPDRYIVQQRSKRRIRTVLGLPVTSDDFDATNITQFGLGTARTMAEFIAFSGIDPRAQKDGDNTQQFMNCGTGCRLCPALLSVLSPLGAVLHFMMAFRGTAKVHGSCNEVAIKLRQFLHLIKWSLNKLTQEDKKRRVEDIHPPHRTTLFMSLYETAVDILDPKIDMVSSDNHDTFAFLWDEGVADKLVKVMLGWGDKSLGFLREICLANESEGGGVVVVLSDRPKAELDMEIHAMVELRGTKILCFKGNPLFAADLLKVSVHRARSITIISTLADTSASDDALVRVLLTLKSLVHPSYVGQLDNKHFMRVVGGDILEALVSRHIVGRLVVLCSRSLHLGRVYNSLLGFGGHEFYLNEWPECIEGDAIIVVAEDNDSYEAEAGPIYIPPTNNWSHSFQKRPLPAPPKRILVCGWRRDLHTILMLLQRLSLPGTTVDLVNSADVDERLETFHADGLHLNDLTNLQVAHIVGSCTSKRQLTDVRVGSYDCIIVMTDKETDHDLMSSDSQILKTVMLLRSMEVQQNRGEMHHVPCIAEVMDTRTQKTIRQNTFIEAAAEWVNSNDLVRWSPGAISIFLELYATCFQRNGIVSYADETESLSFWQIARRASVLYHEIACGYVYMTKTGDDAAPIVLNPKDKSTLRCWNKFCIVVLRDSAHRATCSDRDESRWKISMVHTVEPVRFVLAMHLTFVAPVVRTTQIDQD
ncbi:hypothetical protein DYB32_009804, partial [Aphanomyces invadans]